MGSIAQLLFPSSCLICGVPETTLCSKCELKIHRNSRPIVIADIKLWSGAFYGDELAQLILMAKEQYNSVARNFLIRLLVESFMRSQSEAPSSPTHLFIPIPSSRASNRSRGFRHAYLLAQGVASELRKTHGAHYFVRELLTVNRKIADQSNLNRVARAENLSGAHSVTRRREMEKIDFNGLQVMLIDDLLTTGSSMREGFRALKEAGITPHGALTAGVSPRVFS